MMRRKAVIIFIIFILGLGGFFFLSKNKKITELKINSENPINEAQVENNSLGEKNNQAFFISGWLPYWAKVEGVKSLQNKLQVFSEINPFAYSVDGAGKLIDKMQIDSAPWPELIAQAKQNNVKIIPTILWGDAVAMHKIFSNPIFLERHIENILAMLDAHNFSGLDIDYEGKDMADRDNFSNFLKTLHEKLSAEKKTLNCTVEARTQDFPPEGFTGTRAMSFANDFSALNKICDSVRVMAYDQVFQIQRANIFKDNSAMPSAPNAENQWVEEVLNYALRFIAPEKLILGISTYGWEFQVEKIKEGFRYTRVKSLSYPEFQNIAKQNDIIPKRTAGGELAFTYKSAGKEYILTMDDGQSVADKIAIAKKLNLAGVSLFKIDGLADLKIFDILQR